MTPSHSTRMHPGCLADTLALLSGDHPVDLLPNPLADDAAALFRP